MRALGWLVPVVALLVGCGDDDGGGDTGAGAQGGTGQGANGGTGASQGGGGTGGQTGGSGATGGVGGGQGGSASCDGNQKYCVDRCVDTQLNIQHCGDCNQPCDPGEVCQGGQCVAGQACDPVDQGACGGDGCCVDVCCPAGTACFSDIPSFYGCCPDGDQCGCIQEPCPDG
jgi:hypothetical protein